MSAVPDTTMHGTGIGGDVGMPPGPLLVIEASTAAGSVAIVTPGRVVAKAAVAMGASYDDLLFPAVLALLRDCALEPVALGGIVCGAGPGSFTSLRIAASLAKGLAHGAGLALYAVPSLLLAPRPVTPSGEYVVHGDALRGERYALRVRIDERGRRLVSGEVHRVPFASLPAFGGDAPRIAVGQSPSPVLEFDVAEPDAANVVTIGDWNGLGPLAIADWEPAYGRLSEAQVVWESKHGHALPVG